MPATALKYRFLPLLFCCFLTIHGNAQSHVWQKPKDLNKKALKKVDKGKKKVKQWKEHIRDWGMDDDLNHELSVAAQLNSNGWSGGLYYLKKETAATATLYSLKFSEIKHEKQLKQQDKTLFPELGTPTPYVFGKINNLYTLQLGYGKEWILLPNVVDDNLSIGLRVNGGFSLAFLKPYYLKLIYEHDSTADLREERYTEENAETFLRKGNKLGSSSWTKGLKEVAYIPGAYIEAATVIRPATQGWFIQTVTLGGNFAFYTKPLPIMAKIKAYQWQASLFVGLSLGKRW